jgi:hypothetical protein
MKRITFFVLFCFCSMQALMADDTSAISSSDELVLQITIEPAMKLGYTHRFNFPFLQGSSPLTEANGIGLALGAEVSPVSLNGIAEAVWTPIAFFQLAAGGSIGSGWNIKLFGSDVYGIGISHANAEGYTEHSGSSFNGLFLKAQMGAVLQADLAALVPGDWHHVVMRTYHEINYRGYTGASSGESWYFENDDGENCNGFNYYGNLLIGYQMPIFLNTVALLAEADMYLYDTPNRSRWGDDRIRWTFSGVLNFTITQKFSAALVTQFRTQRNYLQSNWKDLYYRNRTLNTSSPLRLEFFRIAAILTYQL